MVTDQGMGMDQNLAKLDTPVKPKRIQMTWNISYNPGNDFVRIEISGRLLSGLLRQTALEGVEFARRHQCSNFLVDIGNATLRCTTNDIYHFMTKTRMKDLGFKITDRIAFTSTQNEISYRFAETVARNRGWVGLTYFLKLCDAEQWLKSSPEHF